MQAVMMGPYLMAALTDHDRDIDLAPSQAATHVQQVDDSSLVTLKTEKGLVLKQTGRTLELVQQSDCFSQMDCTFRLVETNT